MLRVYHPLLFAQEKLHVSIRGSEPADALSAPVTNNVRYFWSGSSRLVSKPRPFWVTPDAQQGPFLCVVELEAHARLRCRCSST